MEVALIILSTILLSAYFSGTEIAYVSANRFQIELERKKGNYAYRILSYLVQYPGRFIAAMLVGNNLALVIYGLFMPVVLAPYLPIENEYLLLLVQTILSTLLILLTAEFLPKAIFSANANNLLRYFALPNALFYFLFYPIVSLMMGLSSFVMRYILRADNSMEERVFTKVDLDNYLRERSEADEVDEAENEVQFMRRALDFSERKAREFMVPRPEMVALEVQQSVAELREEFIDSNLSKILIYKDSIDNIIGYVHSFELFKKPRVLRDVLRPVRFIPESMAADEVLSLFIREKRSIVVVLDEFGGTSGLITLEDVVEEIFGEIDDEHDVEEYLEQRINEREFVFAARLEISYLNDKYRFNLPEGEQYTTLGGLLISHLESIPRKGEKLSLEHFHFTVEAVSRAKIESVRMRLMESE